MSLSTLALATLAATLDARTAARVTDTDARAIARRMRDTAKADTLADTAARIASANHYTPEDDARMATLIPLWNRARAMRNAISIADTLARETYRDRRTTPDWVAIIADATVRADRIGVLMARVYAATGAKGAFGLSAHDANATTSRFIGTAANKRYTFKGGRDVIAATVFDLTDIFQDACERAIRAGDATPNGIPFYGSFFRHVNAARAHATNMAGAEWRGIVGHFDGSKPAELAYPLTDDKHAMRKLGTIATNGLPYGDRDSHAAAMGDAERETQLALIDDAVTYQARDLALAGADKAEFGTQLARVILDGATVADLTSGLGLTLDTIKRNAIASPRIVSGLNHEIVIDDDVSDFHVMSAHADRLRNAWVAGGYADSIRNGFFASPADIRTNRLSLMTRPAATIDSGKPFRAEPSLTIARTQPSDRMRRLARLESLLVRRESRRAGVPELGASFIR